MSTTNNLATALRLGRLVRIIAYEVVPHFIGFILWAKDNRPSGILAMTMEAVV